MMHSIRFAVLALLVIAGVAAVNEAVLNYPFLTRKLQGEASDCPWWQVIRGTRAMLRFNRLEKATTSGLRQEETDQGLDLLLVESPERSFWIRRSGNEYGGIPLLGYLLAEHQWLEELDPQDSVRPGDVVLDCGAHVGVFTHRALAHGAARVIAVEPDPVNLECLRRNFVREISGGKVVVVPKAVWNAAGTISLGESTQNSGSNSAVLATSGPSVEVAATTVDRISAEFGPISYIKMDIEGAERKALAGARETLRKYKPRLMIESYHLPDDGRVLPSVILAANPHYSIECGACGIMNGKVVPYVLYGR